MAQIVHPNNLKSFQRISAEDLRYLKELRRAGDNLERLEKLAVDQDAARPLLPRLRFKSLSRWMAKIMRRSVDRIFYETVPAEHSDQA